MHHRHHNIQVPTATPLPTQPPTAFLTASTPKQEPAPRRARLASTGFRRHISSRPSLSSNSGPFLKERRPSPLNSQARITSQRTCSTASSSSGQVDPLGKDKVAFQATTIGLSVGKLECRFPCPATFSSDRCTYLFQHPFEAKEVLMIMYYRDMLHASVHTADKSFRFRLSRVLEQFGDDYSPINAQHWIRIVLATSSEAQKVKLFLAGLGVIDKKRVLLCNSHK
ncbi:hypothetical protein GQ600_16191 [Phytophthora cactorum]|nr:hypothetical protein GQ600_16191 [Phytophthora cactorum]